MIYKIVSFLVIIIIICYTLEPAVLATDLNHEPKSGVVTSDDTPKNQKVPPVCTDFIPTPKMEIDDPSLNSKNYNKALEESNVALKLFPTNVHVLMKKIIALVGLKEYKNALTCCDQLFKVDSLKGYSARAYVFLSSNDYKNALVNGDEAIKLDKSNVEGWINKVNALIGLKEYKKALDASNEIIKLDKSNINGWINKANALMALHKYDEALDASNEIIKLDKSNINGWILKARSLYCLGDYREAYKTNLRVLELDPSNEMVLVLQRECLRVDPNCNAKSLLQHVGEWVEFIEKGYNCYERFYPIFSAIGVIAVVKVIFNYFRMLFHR